MRVEAPTLVGQQGRNDLVDGQVFAGYQRKHVQSAGNLGAIDPAVIPVGRPESTHDQMLFVDGTTIEIADLNRVGRVGEIDQRDAALVPGLDEDVAARDRNDGAVMCHAVFLLDLRGRQLEVAAKLELTVDDVVDGIRAPVQRVVGAAARPAAAAPLVGEQDLGAVVVERRRMPVSKARVDHFVQALRVQRVGDVEQDAIARARAASNPELGKHGNVVALICLIGLLRIIAMIATFPETRQVARLGIGEHGGAADNARLGRIVDRDLDDVDAKQRGPVIARQLVDAAFHLLPVAYGRGAGVVDDDLAVFVRARDDRMRVRAATGLHLTHLHRPCQVTDINNAQPAETLRANVFAHAAEPAIDPRPCFLHRHEQQVADDGDIALPARADNRAEQFRHAVFL